MWTKIIGTHEAFAGRTLDVNQEVYKSEAATNQRNQAIGELMFAYGLHQGDPKQATDVYTRQCSINVNAKDLATMAATLANGGKNPVTGKQVIDAEHVPRSPRGDGDRRALRRLRQVAVPHGPAGQERRRRRHHRGVARASSASRSSRRRSTRPATACAAQKAIADISNALGGNPYAAPR